MAYIKNKMLYVANSTGEYIPFYEINDEIFLTDDLISKEIFDTECEYIKAVLSPTSIQVIRIFLLNKDETPNLDISEYILNDWNIDFEYGNGGIRSGNINIVNIQNQWFPSPTCGTIWKGSKFKIFLGLVYSGIVYWSDCGIFVSGNPTIDNDKCIISLPLYDKFSLLDGTIGGKRATAFKIPTGMTVKNAISLCLNEDKGNGEQYDYKSLIFPSEYLDNLTPYTITKDPNTCIGEIIIELAKMINCDVYYNVDGNLTISKGAISNDDLNSFPILWSFKKGQYTLPVYDIKFDSVFNEITVSGSIENGKQYSATITNNSPKSQMNIYMTEPNPLYIEDSNIIGNNNCEVRAKYEMIQQGRLGFQMKFQCIFIPHIKCNQLITFGDNYLGFINETFIVNSISFSNLSGINLSVSNINEVIFK